MKNWLRSSSWFAATVFFGLLVGCAGTAGNGKRLMNAELRLLSFGSVNGELAPCG